MPIILDSNLIIRYLVGDNKEKSDAVEKLFSSKEKLLLTDVTFSEIIWTVSSYYKLSQKQIVEKMRIVLAQPNIKANREILLKALSLYGHYHISWIDCYLAAVALKKSSGRIYSYDKDFDKIKEIKRQEPL